MKVEITFDTLGIYFYNICEAYDVKQGDTAAHWEVLDGQHKGRDIWKGHCEVVK